MAHGSTLWLLGVIWLLISSGVKCLVHEDAPRLSIFGASRLACFLLLIIQLLLLTFAILAFFKSKISKIILLSAILYKTQK
jgi:hypothetical protein